MSCRCCGSYFDAAERTVLKTGLTEKGGSSSSPTMKYCWMWTESLKKSDSLLIRGGDSCLRGKVMRGAINLIHQERTSGGDGGFG